MNVLIRVLSVLLNVIHFLITPIFWIRARGKRQSLPVISDPLLRISATDLAEKIRNREVSSEHVCLAFINRIKEVNPILNAVVEDRFESALHDARSVDAFLRISPLSKQELENVQPLLGVPLTVKESCSVAGLSLCVGTLQRVGIKASSDGDVVSKLKASGAIPLLVSNTPEICLSWESTNFVTGTTNNPYDTTRTSSGSSGGEGALLGSAASVIGIGSDIAGSIRMPALFNGIFGHKPTPRVISIKGHHPYCQDENYAEYLVIGPMARYAQDLKLMTKVMASNPSELRLDEKVDLSKVKVFYMKTMDDTSLALPRVQTEIKLAIQRSAEFLKFKCNSQIIEDCNVFADLKHSLEIAGSVLYKIKDIPNLLKGEKSHSLPVELCKSALGMSKFSTNLLNFYLFQWLYNTFVTNDEYCHKNEYLRQLFVEQLGDNGVFLFPTFPTSAFRHNSFLYKSAGISYLMIVNTLGLPATHVPCGLDKNGLPIGLQVIAAPHQDRLCLAVAEELEKCFGGWIPPT